MARVRDLWWTATKPKRKTSRHPDNGGSPGAKRWLACWTAPNGKEDSKAFRTQDAAKKYARKMEEDVERGEYIDPGAGKTLVGPLGRKYLRLRDVGGSSAERYERALRLIEKAFGERQVKSVKPSEVLEWLRELARTHGSSTQEICYFILSGIFDLAVADGMRKDNPAKSPIVPKPRQEESEREVWPTSTVWAVAEAHPEPYRLIPILSSGAGLRQGEAFGVAEEDFDFDGGVVHVRRQVAKVGTAYYFKLPKFGKERTVPLSPGVARLVQAYIAERPPRPYALPWMQEKGLGVADEEHVCKILFRWHGDDPRTHDLHIKAGSFNQRVWKPALAQAGVISSAEKNDRGKRVYDAARGDGSHALRHYLSTVLQDARISPAGVMEILGHSKKGLPVTFRTYGHVTDATFEAAREAIDRALFPLRVVQDHRATGTGAEQAVSG